jgi:hypothetical protein
LPQYRKLDGRWRSKVPRLHTMESTQRSVGEKRERSADMCCMVSLVNIVLGEKACHKRPHIRLFISNGQSRKIIETVKIGCQEQEGKRGQRVSANRLASFGGDKMVLELHSDNSYTTV